MAWFGWLLGSKSEQTRSNSNASNTVSQTAQLGSARARQWRPAGTAPVADMEPVSPPSADTQTTDGDITRQAFEAAVEQALANATSAAFEEAVQRNISGAGNTARPARKHSRPLSSPQVLPPKRLSAPHHRSPVAARTNLSPKSPLPDYEEAEEHEQGNEQPETPSSLEPRPWSGWRQKPGPTGFARRRSDGSALALNAENVAAVQTQHSSLGPDVDPASLDISLRNPGFRAPSITQTNSEPASADSGDNNNNIKHGNEDDQCKDKDEDVKSKDEEVGMDDEDVVHDDGNGDDDGGPEDPFKVLSSAVGSDLEGAISNVLRIASFTRLMQWIHAQGSVSDQEDNDNDPMGRNVDRFIRRYLNGEMPSLDDYFDFAAVTPVQQSRRVSALALMIREETERYGDSTDAAFQEWRTVIQQILARGDSDAPARLLANEVVEGFINKVGYSKAIDCLIQSLLRPARQITSRVAPQRYDEQPQDMFYSTMPLSRMAAVFRRAILHPDDPQEALRPDGRQVDEQLPAWHRILRNNPAFESNIEDLIATSDADWGHLHFILHNHINDWHLVYAIVLFHISREGADFSDQHPLLQWLSSQRLRFPNAVEDFRHEYVRGGPWMQYLGRRRTMAECNAAVLADALVKNLRRKLRPESGKMSRFPDLTEESITEGPQRDDKPHQNKGKDTGPGTEGQVNENTPEEPGKPDQPHGPDPPDQQDTVDRVDKSVDVDRPSAASGSKRSKVTQRRARSEPAEKATTGVSPPTSAQRSRSQGRSSSARKRRASQQAYRPDESIANRNAIEPQAERQVKRAKSQSSTYGSASTELPNRRSRSEPAGGTMTRLPPPARIYRSRSQGAGSTGRKRRASQQAYRPNVEAADGDVEELRPKRQVKKAKTVESSESNDADEAQEEQVRKRTVTHVAVAVATPNRRTTRSMTGNSRPRKF